MEGDQKMSGGANYQPESNEEGEYLYSAPNSRPNREKLNSILILCVGFFAVMIGGVSMWINIANPFAGIIKQGLEQDRQLAVAQQAELLALQTKDTDGDGLNDYDELNKYQSSPYLKDSDGDGIDDKTEAVRGTDPNCPEGQNCFTSNSGSTATTSVGAPQLQTSLSSPAVSITPAYIRQIMKENGATDEQLSSFTDEELMAEFQKYLADNPQMAADLAASGVNVNIGAGATVPTLAQPSAGSLDLKALNVSNIEDLKKLTGPQVRQLMIDAGASASVLSAVSDEDLKTAFLKQLESKISAP